MAHYIIIGLLTEGPTDIRFLESIVRKTYDDIAFECRHDIDTNITIIDKNKNALSFIEQLSSASLLGYTDLGISILCVHTDADGVSEDNIYQTKIQPALNHIEKLGIDCCQNITPIIPVRMTESWMLADKELLKKQIGTDMSDDELGINRNPESIANPKFIIEEAIRISRQHMVRRRRSDLTISDLYLPIGQQLSLDRLKTLSSYNRFRERVIDSYRFMGLHD